MAQGYGDPDACNEEGVWHMVMVILLPAMRKVYGIGLW